MLDCCQHGRRVRPRYNFNVPSTLPEIDLKLLVGICGLTSCEYGHEDCRSGEVRQRGISR